MRGVYCHHYGAASNMPETSFVHQGKGELKIKPSVYIHNTAGSTSQFPELISESLILSTDFGGHHVPSPYMYYASRALKPILHYGKLYLLRLGGVGVRCTRSNHEP